LPWPTIEACAQTKWETPGFESLLGVADADVKLLELEKDEPDDEA